MTNLKEQLSRNLPRNMTRNLLRCFLGVIFVTLTIVYAYFQYSWINGSNPVGTCIKYNISQNQEEQGLFDLVTNFVPFDHEDVRKGLRVNGMLPTDDEINSRMAEIFDCLQRNLENILVARVHVLVFRNETVKRLSRLKMNSIHKLVIHKNKQSPTIKDAVVYASNYLRGKTVILLHQDNYLGEGWEKVNHKMLRNNCLMYALTRHSVNCHASLRAANCGLGYPYIGSHDVFVLHVNDQRLEIDKFKELDVPPNTNGMENVLLWIFRNRLNYKILNPCLVLKVFHNHCVPVRDNWRKRINQRDMSATAGFTDKLQ